LSHFVTANEGAGQLQLVFQKEEGKMTRLKLTMLMITAAALLSACAV